MHDIVHGVMSSTAAPSRTHGMRARLLMEDMEYVPGGSFWMGSNRHYKEEAPAHEATVDSFWMDRFPVTNAQFARFTAQTGYVTVAERPIEPADYPGALDHLLVPGSMVFTRPRRDADLSNPLMWWRYVPGACWRNPYGRGTSIGGKADHPVVHIAYEDAAAYARWAGKELPTEIEWERAARGGLDRTEYAWGDELTPDGRVMANVWQGVFPHLNLAPDGYAGTTAVGSFPANGYDLYDLIGNVWEWTVDPWDQHAALRRSPCAERGVMKGGSFLSAANHCSRYRPAARLAQRLDTATCHQGFRCVIRGGA